MNIIAWIGSILTMLRVIKDLHDTFTEKTINKRIACFIVAILNGIVAYFFFNYLFR